MIIGYLRVSMGKQHLANQQDEIRRFAASRNLVVDHLLRNFLFLFFYKIIFIFTPVFCEKAMQMVCFNRRRMVI